MDPVKTEVNTEYVKTEQNIKTNQDSRGIKYVHKTIKTIPF